MTPVPRTREISFFIALLATALALGAALAHLYELPNKIAISREHYLIVQRNYDGWAQLAYVLAAQLAAILATLALTRRDPRVVRWVAVALLALVASQAVFWIYTYPANAATANWTVLPEGWERLRLRWEYSHAAGALLQLTAFCALVMALLARRT